jgi:hypothetical protein
MGLWFIVLKCMFQNVKAGLSVNKLKTFTCVRKQIKVSMNVTKPNNYFNVIVSEFFKEKTEVVPVLN